MHRLSRLEATIQESSAIRALLTSLDFLNLRPLFFGRQSLSYAGQAIYFPSFSLWHHQNLWIEASSLSQIVDGILEDDIV